MTRAPTVEELKREIQLDYLQRVGVDVSPEFETALLAQAREKIVTGGWQAGKSTEGAAEIWKELPIRNPDRDYRYWVIVPSYKSPRKEMDYLYEWGAKMNIVSRSHFPDNDSCRLELFRGQVLIETKTAQDPEGIAGEPCDGVLVVEAGQMPESIRTQAQGRIMTRRGWITYTGTLEDDEAKPRWVWYGKLAGEWMENPTADHAAFSLPSWANRTVFPLGRNDPEMQRLSSELDGHTFSRRVAGVPSGVQYPVYPMLISAAFFYARDGVPLGQDKWINSMGAGGHDYGETYGHPSTLAAVTVNDRDEAWVREVRWERGGDTNWIEYNRRELSAKYKIPLSRWGFDPMQKEAARQAGAIAVAASTRELRAGQVEARLNARKLFWDITGPGVKSAYEQAQRVHYIKKLIPGEGEKYVYARTDDDLMAGVEDAIHVIATVRKMPFSMTGTISYPQRDAQRTREYTPLV